MPATLLVPDALCKTAPYRGVFSCHHSPCTSVGMRTPSINTRIFLSCANRTVSRILSASIYDSKPRSMEMIIYLGCTLPHSSSRLPAAQRQPIRRCTRPGLPRVRVATHTCELLPHSFHPYLLAKAVSFLWHYLYPSNTFGLDAYLAYAMHL